MARTTPHSVREQHNHPDAQITPAPAQYDHPATPSSHDRPEHLSHRTPRRRLFVTADGRHGMPDTPMARPEREERSL